jgi:hypothetical protein
MRVCIFFYLCFLLMLKLKKDKNNKKKKKELSVLICIWSSILRTNKIILYFQ